MKVSLWLIFSGNLEESNNPGESSQINWFQKKKKITVNHCSVSISPSENS